MKTAKWWHREGDNIVCSLCPRLCIIHEGKAGFCNVRVNKEGTLYSLSYGRPAGVATDPIEKKPLYHFFPGSSIFSIGTIGCNLNCKFCQNWHLSRGKPESVESVFITPEEIVNLTVKSNTSLIAFTYNEPIVFGEYVIDIISAAKEKGIKTVVVSAGYVEDEARKEIFSRIDAANIDLKSFNEDFYKKMTGASLASILETLKWIKTESDTWLEITNLIIPGENDSEEEIRKMASWISANLGENVPLHFSAFFPNYKLTEKPRTEDEILIKAKKIAESEGIRYCYIGNAIIHGAQSTFCYKCGAEVIKRDRFYGVSNMMAFGRCASCGEKIPGIYKQEEK